ncbi:hypothetical protein AYL99_12113 [Fonsecaea erecta]|uniref:Aspergillopepsin-2 n=1 Tax=Fonsecaea erecta TaxID=1367422 RepID=A0A178Z1Y5_9EURO|nr:hypothetical protein AYL99_12113 [Fonsecaea erecta]OAP53707.1 hypothetical protein AYL99_12113 [Fonsecaea erecta]
MKVADVFALALILAEGSFAARLTRMRQGRDDMHRYGLSRRTRPPTAKIKMGSGQDMRMEVHDAMKPTAASRRWSIATNSILQSGIDFYVDDDVQGFDAWYERYPNSAYDFKGMKISTGDEIMVTDTANSATESKVTIENLSTGQTWIVEDFEENDMLVPFVNFDNVTFTMSPATSGDTTYGSSGATVMEIMQKGSAITDVSIQGSQIVVQRIQS